MAYRFLRGNISRAIFPLAGVIVGSMALVMTLSLGDGAKRVIDKDLSAIGKNRVLLEGSFSKRDLELVERLPFVEYGIFPENRVLVNSTVFRGYSQKAIKAMGLPKLRDGEVVLDKTQFSNVEIGNEIELETSLGKRIFKIRELYSEESPFETMKLGDRVIVSDSTFEKYFGRSGYKSLVISFPQDEDGVDYIPVVLRELNRSRFGANQVRVLETPDVYRKVERIRGFVSKGLLILSLISLSVGGIGVLNLIAAAVRERGSYIGILRTMGMKRERLMEIFLLEAGIVVCIGALLGAILGLLLAHLAGVVLNIPPYFNFSKIVLALILTLLIGMVFGVLPAREIGKLEIVEALKI
ncbi:MAG: ABC transporter permease [Peptostreptococcaceae bacterium]